MADGAWPIRQRCLRTVASIFGTGRLVPALLSAVAIGGAVLCTAIPTPALAESAVGAAIVEGKKVTLFSDGTWQFDDIGPADCKTVTKRIDFCPTDPAWQPSKPATPAISAAFRHDDRKYGQYVVEELGTADGLTMDAFREAILGIAESSTGAAPAVVTTEETRVGDLPAETVVYAVATGGMAVVFSNTILLTEKSAVQIQTYELGTSDYTDEHRKMHDAFVTATKFKAE